MQRILIFIATIIPMRYFTYLSHLVGPTYFLFYLNMLIYLRTNFVVKFGGYYIEVNRKYTDFISF